MVAVTESTTTTGTTKQRRYTRKKKERQPMLTLKKGDIEIYSDGCFFFALQHTTTIEGWGLLNFGTVDIPEGYALYLDAENAGADYGVLIVPKMFWAGKDYILSMTALNISPRDFRTLYAGEKLVRGVLVKTATGEKE